MARQARGEVADGVPSSVHHTARPPLTRPFRHLALRGQRPAGTSLPAPDAMFWHIDTPCTPQQTTAVLVLAPRPDGSPPPAAELTDALAALPGLDVRLDPGGSWHRPFLAPVPIEGWRPRMVVAQDGAPGLAAAVDARVGARLAVTSRAADATVISGRGDGRSVVVISTHHAVADGEALARALAAPARGRGAGEQDGGARPSSNPERTSSRGRASTSWPDLVRGLWSLARSGRAPHGPLTGPVRTPRRHVALGRLGLADVRAAARAESASPTAALVAIVGEGLCATADRAAHSADVVRVVVPMSLRGSGTQAAANRTGAARIDVPIGPMPLAARIRVVNRALRAQRSSAAPSVAQLVVGAIGHGPPWLHRALARLLYRGTWFSAIVTVLPGRGAPVTLAGSSVEAVYPVLPLAAGVRVTVGMIRWGDGVTVAVTESLGTGLADRVVTAMERASRPGGCSAAASG